MRFHRQHEQTDSKEIESLIRGQTMALLITFPKRETVHLGIFNTLFHDGRFFLHIGKTDEQYSDLVLDPRCILVFQDILSVIPSYWIDERCGGTINQFFRYAEFHCHVRRIEDSGEMRGILQLMLDRFQKERRYDPVDPNSEVYRDKFQLIACLELTANHSRTKWNVGQTEPLATFNHVINELKNRARDCDIRTAGEMQRWLVLHGIPKI